MEPTLCEAISMQNQMRPHVPTLRYSNSQITVFKFLTTAQIFTRIRLNGTCQELEY